MSFRCFANPDEVVADQWSSETVTSETWTLGGPIGTGESGSINIASAAGLRGACKPGFAVAPQQRGFSLVSWRNVLDNCIGQHISCMASPGEVDWSLQVNSARPDFSATASFPYRPATAWTAAPEIPR
jgi:hypothetical protein